MKTTIKLKLILFFAVLQFGAVSSQWQQTAGIPSGAGVTDMVVLNDGTLIVTTASYNWPSGQTGGIRRSTNGGASWQNIMNIYTSRTVHLGSSGRLFASCWVYPDNEGMFFSTNNGLNWQQSFFGDANDNVFSIASKNGDSMVYVGTRDGVFRSFNNGAWIQLGTGMPANSWVRDLAIINNKIYAATTKGLFKSTNQGNSWYSLNGIAAGDTVVKLELGRSAVTDNGDDPFFFVGTSNGRLYVSDGEPYEVYDITYFLLGYEVSGIASVGDFVIMSLYPRGGGNSIVVTSHDRGETWGVLPPAGLPLNFKFSALTVKFNPGDYLQGSYNLYTGMFMNSNNGAGIFSLSSVIGLEPISNEMPDKFELLQNYPNPFNPTTNIGFRVAQFGSVSLKVYDIAGKEVAVLINENLSTGIYNIGFDASGFTSGIYFYRIQAEGYIETKKMILVK